MQALILAGGEGTRLRPLTLQIPKPIVPIGNQPFLLRQIELLKNAGITDIILSLNYQPSAIKEVLGDCHKFGVNLRYLIEPTPMGTAGAFKFAEPYLKSSTIVLNGDILTDIDLNAVINHHRDNHSAATIVLTKVENPSAYGVVQIGSNSEVIKFLEKPKLSEIQNLNTINAGIYIFEPDILNFIPKNEKFSFEYQLFPSLLKQKVKFNAFVATDSYWLDIGTPERYLQAHSDLISGKFKNFKVNRKLRKDLTKTFSIDDKSMIGKGCIIKNGAKIINSILGENVVMGESTSVENSVIWARTTVDSNTVIKDSIVGYDCRIGKNVWLKNNSVLGNYVILSDYTIL